MIGACGGGGIRALDQALVRPACASEGGSKLIIETHRTHTLSHHAIAARQRGLAPGEARTKGLTSDRLGCWL